MFQAIEGGVQRRRDAQLLLSSSRAQAAWHLGSSKPDCFRRTALIERNAECVATLRTNGFRCVRCCDAFLEDFSRFPGAELVAGGPPCQPFSVEGKGRGADDERDGWHAAIRAVREIKPRAFVFENVMGMMRAQFEHFWNCILKQFYEMGY
eukprot:2866847-Prymnesium_polylepis.1